MEGCQPAIHPTAVALICLNGPGIFALGVQHHVLYGQLGWLVLFATALGYIAVVRYLPKKAYGLPVVLGRSDSDADEEELGP